MSSPVIPFQSLAPYTSTSRDTESHFYVSLEPSAMRQLKIYPSFIQFVQKADPLSLSTPLLLHSRRDVVDVWIAKVDDTPSFHTWAGRSDEAVERNEKLVEQIKIQVCVECFRDHLHASCRNRSTIRTYSATPGYFRPYLSEGFPPLSPEAARCSWQLRWRNSRPHDPTTQGDVRSAATHTASEPRATQMNHFYPSCPFPAW
ncbi:hypothetical protein EV363DRAFT_1475045 [Boletus edulis]|nr:hypothetical protein EV363DRAFT_1475045 [Boletus edulis]